MYIWADGGLGKTRLLQELQNLCREAGPEFRSRASSISIIRKHSTSEMERAIVGDWILREYRFWNTERSEPSTMLREHGASPYVLEGLRVQLSEYLVRESAT